MITVANFGVATTRSADCQILCVRAVNLVWLVCGIAYGAKQHAAIDCHVTEDICVNFYKFFRSILALQEPLTCPFWGNFIHISWNWMTQVVRARSIARKQVRMRTIVEASAHACSDWFKSSWNVESGTFRNVQFWPALNPLSTQSVLQHLNPAGCPACCSSACTQSPVRVACPIAIQRRSVEAFIQMKHSCCLTVIVALHSEEESFSPWTNRRPQWTLIYIAVNARM